MEEAGLEVQLNNVKSIGGLCFVDEFVGMSNASENLQKLIFVVHKFGNRWRLNTNVSKCAVVVFQRVKHLVAGYGHSTNIKLLLFGTDFTSDGGWDTQVKRAISIVEGRKLISFTALLVIGIYLCA